jgi:hypothetical protein
MGGLSLRAPVWSAAVVKVQPGGRAVARSRGRLRQIRAPDTCSVNGQMPGERVASARLLPAFLWALLSATNAS